jgi:2'-5' RNA ligase
LPAAPDLERLRLFVAYRLPGDIVERLIGWQRTAFKGLDGVRPTLPESLHITLVFLGSQPATAVAGLVDTIRRATAAARQPCFKVWRYRETPRVGMLTLSEQALPGDHYTGRANEHTGRLMSDFQRAGIYEPEKRDWKPHITVARFRTPPRARPVVPDLGTFSALDVALYASKLSPLGSTYTVLESAPFPSEASPRPPDGREPPARGIDD